MKFVIFALLVMGFGAQAAQYTCSDETIINRTSSQAQIIVTINGVTQQCEQTLVGAKRCSDPASSSQCSGAIVGGSCVTRYGEKAICYGTGSTGVDGVNTDCTCSVGG